MLHKSDFVTKVVDVLENNGIGKYFPKFRSTLHVSDDNGDCHDFKVVHKGKLIPYDYDDIRYVMQAIGAVIEDNIRRGEAVLVPDVGKFEVRKTKPRTAYNVSEGRVAYIPWSYKVRFTPSKKMSMSAKMYTDVMRQMGAAEASEMLDGCEDDEVDEYGD